MHSELIRHLGVLRGVRRAAKTLPTTPTATESVRKKEPGSCQTLARTRVRVCAVTEQARVATRKMARSVRGDRACARPKPDERREADATRVLSTFTIERVIADFCNSLLQSSRRHFPSRSTLHSGKYTSQRHRRRFEISNV